MKVAARALVLALLSAHLVIGQAKPPSLVEFVASSDHFALYCKSANGLRCTSQDSLIGWVISHYRARVYRIVGSTRTLVFDKNLGRPYPDVRNRIAVTLSPEIDGIGPGQYVVSVVAIGPGGTSPAGEMAFGDTLAPPSNLKVFP